MYSLATVPLPAAQLTLGPGGAGNDRKRGGSIQDWLADPWSTNERAVNAIWLVVQPRWFRGSTGTSAVRMHQ